MHFKIQIDGIVRHPIVPDTFAIGVTFPHDGENQGGFIIYGDGIFEQSSIFNCVKNFNWKSCKIGYDVVEERKEFFCPNEKGDIQGYSCVDESEFDVGEMVYPVAFLIDYEDDKSDMMVYGTSSGDIELWCPKDDLEVANLIFNSIDDTKSFSN